MQDDFDDSGLGMPDDEVADGDLGDLGVGGEGELDFGLEDEDEDMPAARRSGGARQDKRRHSQSPGRLARARRRPRPEKLTARNQARRRRSPRRRRSRSDEEAAREEGRSGRPPAKSRQEESRQESG